MKVGTGGNLGLSREYHKKLVGPLFYPWWNCDKCPTEMDLHPNDSFKYVNRIKTNISNM